MNCWYCDKDTSQHDNACPLITGKFDLFQAGWYDGRKRNEQRIKDPTYLVGWRSGNSAADEAENTITSLTGW